MIIEKNVSMIFPNSDLGRKIASEDCKTQCQTLGGFASKQLLSCTYNSQTIINLVALLSSETILWFIKIYQEIVKQGKLPIQAIKYNEKITKEALTKISHT